MDTNRARSQKEKQSVKRRPMRGFVGSLGGNVGKTAIAMNLIQPRLAPGTKFISVESINESASDLGMDAEKLRGNQFRELFGQILTVPSVVVDVGASNVEAFLQQFTLYKSAVVDEVDFFIVPVVPKAKEQQEAIKLVNILNHLGIPSSKIKAVFNMVATDAEDECEAFLAFAKGSGKCFADPAAAILTNELFDLMGRQRTSITSILADETNYRPLIATEPDPAELSKLIDKFTARTLAVGVQKELDGVFDVLFGSAE